MKYLIFIFALLATATQPLMAQQNPTLGSNWKGYIDLQGQELPIKTAFSKDGDSYTGNIHLQGVTLPLQKIHVGQQDSVRFQFSTNVNVARFKGTFKNDSTLSGHYYQAGQEFTFILKRYEPKINQDSSDINHTEPSKILHNAALIGNWKGTIKANVPLLIKTYFKEQDAGFKGTLEIQGTKLSLQDIEVTGDDSVHFEFQSGNGLATFKGSFESDSSIAGDFMQKGFTFPFKLHRFEPDTMQKETEKKPLPYHHKDLIIKNDSIDIGGTLTWPENGKADQLVIMISGSGAQDRDALTPVSDFKPFAKLADSLTLNGIATFRYDDRDIGESTGNFSNATLGILASDVKTIIHYFKNDADQQFNQIILLGHSQGGVVGGKVAAKNKDVAKLILMASPGIKLKRVTDFQVRAAMKRAGLNKRQIDLEMAARDRLISALQKQENVAQAKQRYTDDHLKLLQSLSDSTVSSEKLQKAAQKETEAIVAAVSNPQFKSLLFYDPTDDLKKLHIPALALFGGKDKQVSVDLNKPPIEKALDQAGVPHEIKAFKNANHFFQKAKTGHVQEYGSLPSEFVDGFLSTIEQWIKQTYEK